MEVLSCLFFKMYNNIVFYSTSELHTIFTFITVLVGYLNRPTDEEVTFFCLSWTMLNNGADFKAFVLQKDKVAQTAFYLAEIFFCFLGG